jgi:hypothetical protein
VVRVLLAYLESIVGTSMRAGGRRSFCRAPLSDMRELDTADNRCAAGLAVVGRVWKKNRMHDHNENKVDLDRE